MGKLVMFFGFVWAITCIAGGIMLGSMPFASASLSADISSSGTTVTVSSTNGFPGVGIIVIGTERIAYSNTTDTEFEGSLAQPLLRGTAGTDAVAHSTGENVRMVESMLVNSSIDYNLAVLADSAGAQAFIAMPVALFDILLSFGTAPFAFLGTDLQILTVIWGIAFLGMLVSFFISMAGGRRV